MYAKIKELAKMKGISINKLEQELGFAKGYLSKIDKYNPGHDKVQKIANYFEITVDELFDKKLSPADKRDISKDLNSIIYKLKNSEEGVASFDGEEIPEEDIELFAGQLELMLKRLKTINKEKYNPHKYGN